MCINIGSPSTISTPLFLHSLSFLNKNARLQAKTWMQQNPGKYKGDQYASMVRVLPCVSTFDLMEEKKNGVTFLLASSFFYERVKFAASLKSKPPIVSECQAV